MSWNGECRIEATMTDDEAREALDLMPIYGGTNAPDETKAAVWIARAAAKTILFSSALGAAPGKEGSPGYSVTINGHANAGHRATGGFVTDSITVTVRQLPGPS